MLKITLSIPLQKVMDALKRRGKCTGLLISYRNQYTPVLSPVRSYVKIFEERPQFLVRESVMMMMIVII